MGCTGSTDEFSGDLTSNQVEIGMCTEQIAAKFHFKILLLGAGESGKSTVTKQLKLIHSFKPTQQELQQIANSLHQNVVDCLKVTLSYISSDAFVRSLRGLWAEVVYVYYCVT